MPLLQINVKSLFDERPVLRAVEREKRSRLGRMGGYVRKVARGSIKRVGKARLRKGETLDVGEGASRRHQNILREVEQAPASAPGQPPYTHTGHLKRDIFYKVDLARDSVPVGAQRFAWLNELLEHGGTARRQVWLHLPTRRTYLFHRGPRGRRQRSKFWKFLRTIVVRYAPRPFMRRALDRSQDRLAKFWEGAVRP
jgi:hypothetical protein